MTILLWSFLALLERFQYSDFPAHGKTPCIPTKRKLATWWLAAARRLRRGLPGDILETRHKLSPDISLPLVGIKINQLWGRAPWRRESVRETACKA